MKVAAFIGFACLLAACTGTGASPPDDADYPVDEPAPHHARAARPTRDEQLLLDRLQQEIDAAERTLAVPSARTPTTSLP